MTEELERGIKQAASFQLTTILLLQQAMRDSAYDNTKQEEVVLLFLDAIQKDQSALDNLMYLEQFIHSIKERICYERN